MIKSMNEFARESHLAIVGGSNTAMVVDGPHGKVVVFFEHMLGVCVDEAGLTADAARYIAMRHTDMKEDVAPEWALPAVFCGGLAADKVGNLVVVKMSDDKAESLLDRSPLRSSDIARTHELAKKYGWK